MVREDNYLCRMEVSPALIEKLSHLSRLEFSDLEKEEIRGDLEKMIAFVEKLNELNLDEVKPLLHIPEEVNVLREDEVRGELSRQEALNNAPRTDGTFFHVPKMIRQD